MFGGKFDRVVHAQWQEIAENSVDMPHFHYVHGTGQGSTRSARMTMDGPFRRVESQQAFNSSKGPSSPATSSEATASARASA